MPPWYMVEDPDGDENHRHLFCYSDFKTLLGNWDRMRKHVGSVSNVELSEYRAGVEYEEKIARIPSGSFLGFVKVAVDREIARREACGHIIHEAEPWPMTESSATVVCKLKEISAKAPISARLLRVLSLPAKGPYTPIYPKQVAQCYRANCVEDDIVLALYHNSRRAKELPYAEFEDLRAAMETLEGMCCPHDKRPKSYAAEICAAIEAELPRRVMVAIMAARERCRGAPAPLGLAALLAALPSRPLEMIAGAVAARFTAASDARAPRCIGGTQSP